MACIPFSVFLSLKLSVISIEPWSPSLSLLLSLSSSLIQVIALLTPSRTVVQQANRGDYSNLMPQYFSEDLLRIYTKNYKWVYLVQLGYRALLEAMPGQVNVDDTSAPAPAPGALSTPPESVAPSTPRARSLSRTTSFSNLSFSGGSGTPFATNSFTTVPPDYAPSSPSHAGLKRKREREGEEGEGREERG